MRGNPSLYCSLLFSLKRQTPSNHNETITLEHRLHGDGERQQLCASFSETPGDTLAWRTGSWNRLPDALLDSHPCKRPHSEMLKLTTFLCKCFYAGRHYFTHHEAFWKETHSSQAAEAVRFAEKTIGYASKNT